MYIFSCKLCHSNPENVLNSLIYIFNTFELYFSLLQYYVEFASNTFCCSEHVLIRIPGWRGVGTPTPLSVSLCACVRANVNAGVDPVARLDSQTYPVGTCGHFTHAQTGFRSHEGHKGVWSSGPARIPRETLVMTAARRSGLRPRTLSCSLSIVHIHLCWVDWLHITLYIILSWFELLIDYYLYNNCLYALQM